MSQAAAVSTEAMPPIAARGGVRLVGVSRSYGSVAALDGLDLEVRPGEFLAIVGPSGSGKSTALRMVAGLDEPTAGIVEIGGADMDGLPPRARDIAMVFQAFALYPHLTVFRNLATPLELQRRPRAEIEHRVGEAAALLDIEFLLNRKPGLLSGGQRQRVALARAMVRNPSVFLFDEPLSNLDAQHRSALRAEIVAMHRRCGASTLYVTHDQNEAVTMADRIAVLRHGRLEQIGTPEDILNRPANVFVAGFFGSPAMNLVPGTVSDDGCVQLGQSILPLRTGLAAGQGVTFGLRPEHLSDRSMPTTSPLKARVASVELAGSSLHAAIDCSGIRLVASMPTQRRLRIGDHLTIHADLARAHLFDAKTGAALAFKREAMH